MVERAGFDEKLTVRLAHLVVQISFCRTIISYTPVVEPAVISNRTYMVQEGLSFQPNSALDTMGAMAAGMRIMVSHAAVEELLGMVELVVMVGDQWELDNLVLAGAVQEAPVVVAVVVVLVSLAWAPVAYPLDFLAVPAVCYLVVMHMVAAVDIMTALQAPEPVVLCGAVVAPIPTQLGQYASTRQVRHRPRHPARLPPSRPARPVLLTLFSLSSPCSNPLMLT